MANLDFFANWMRLDQLNCKECIVRSIKYYRKREQIKMEDSFDFVFIRNSSCPLEEGRLIKMKLQSIISSILTGKNFVLKHQIFVNNKIWKII